MRPAPTSSATVPPRPRPGATAPCSAPNTPTDAEPRSPDPRRRDPSSSVPPSSLATVDWNFSNAPPARGLHAIHPYPAKFIPEIPRNLIKLFHPGDDSLVFDPFCGSGTTLLEANRLGLDAVGIDLHPLACLIARVKTRPPEEGLLRDAARITHLARENASRHRCSIPPIPRLGHWFRPHVQRALAALVNEVSALETTFVREALMVALSRIIVSVSNQESDTRYAAVAKDVSLDDVFTRFDNAATLVADALYASRSDLFAPRSHSTVLTADVLSVEAKALPHPIGLVVTSPPYPNAYEYWLYHKYRMYWLGMDPIAVRTREIGARPHYFKTNHQTEHHFAAQMTECFELLASVLRPHSMACFVIGPSLIHGRLIDNAAILEQAARARQFALHDRTQRTILRSRKAFNLSHARIQEETILVFRYSPKQ